MKIEVTKTLRSKNAPDESCIHYLYVNGVSLGAWYGGKDKKYLNPEKWAKEMIPKRVKVLDRNIKRLYAEADEFEKERAKLLCE